ncbi:MAG: cytochrome c [Oligoflexia bacterium]|nr:cytochrome c [Oligoflexia bacterium]
MKFANSVKLVLSAVTFALAISIPSARAEDIAAGKAIGTTVCAACHGPQGISMNPLWPNLAGQKKDYILKQLKSFQDGSRKDPLMSPVAKNLSASDVQNLAAYFAGLKAN